MTKARELVEEINELAMRDIENFVLRRKRLGTPLSKILRDLVKSFVLSNSQEREEVRVIATRIFNRDD